MATLDVLTIEAALIGLGYKPSDKARADRLQPMLTAVSLRLDELVGPIVQRPVTESHDGGCTEIRLRARPLASISSVVEYVTGTATTLAAETVTSSPGNAYLAPASKDNPGLLSGCIYRRSGFVDWAFQPGRQNIVVTAVAGRFVDTAAAAASRYAEAARLMLKNAWGAELNSSANIDEWDVPAAAFPGVAVPKVVRELLADQLLYEVA